MIKAVIFDIDGVLLDSFESNFRFCKAVMKNAGYALTRDAYRTMFHRTLWDVIKDSSGLTDDREIQKILDVAKTMHYDYEGAVMTPGAKDVIKELSTSYMLGVVSSRIRITMDKFLKQYDLEKYFDVSVAFEDTERHKPDPEPLLLGLNKIGASPNEAIYIGDALTDVQASNDAQMKCIAYPAMLEGANGYVEDLKDLPLKINLL